MRKKILKSLMALGLLSVSLFASAKINKEKVNKEVVSLNLKNYIFAKRGISKVAKAEKLPLEKKKEIKNTLLTKFFRTDTIKERDGSIIHYFKKTDGEIALGPLFGEKAIDEFASRALNPKKETEFAEKCNEEIKKQDKQIDRKEYETGKKEVEELLESMKAEKVLKTEEVSEQLKNISLDDVNRAENIDLKVLKF